MYCHLQTDSASSSSPPGHDVPTTYIHRAGPAVACLTAVREVLDRTTLWAFMFIVKTVIYSLGCVHLSCTAQVNSAFYPPWDGKWVSAFGLSNNNKWWLCLYTIAAYRWTHSPSHVAWSEGWRPLGAVLHSSNEPSELSQWTCGHDDKHYKYRPGYYYYYYFVMHQLKSRYHGHGIVT